MRGDWRTVRLGELFQLHHDGVNPATFPEEHFEHFSIPAYDEIKGPNLELGRTIESNKTLLSTPVVLVSKLNPRKPRVVLVEGDTDYRRCASTEWMPYAQTGDETHLGFYKWFFCSGPFHVRLERVATGSTNSHVRVRPSETLNWFVPHPPLPEQRRIAEILDTLDEVIRKTEQVIAKLQQMKQGLLHDLLTLGLDDNGELRDPDRHPEQFKDSPLGRIPKAWEVTPLGSRFAVKGGKRLPAGHVYATSQTGFRYLRVLDFFGRAVRLEELESLSPRTFDALSRYEITDGDLYISIAGSIGYVGVYRCGEPDVRTILTENAARVVRLVEDEPDFVALQANHSSVQQQISVEMGTGGGVPKLALFRIERLKFAWPDVAEQRRIADLATIPATRIEREAEQLNKLRTLKQGLMDDLLTGRVRVSFSEESHR